MLRYCIGVQACGGPQGYIPYATTIDVETFLGMVADYNAQEQAYNEHYEIVSTCSLPAQPTAIRCENDLPVLVY